MTGAGSTMLSVSRRKVDFQFAMTTAIGAGVLLRGGNCILSNGEELQVYIILGTTVRERSLVSRGQSIRVSFLSRRPRSIYFRLQAARVSWS
jgi:hypothetical protein